jgi:hypothetical protein
MIEPDPHVPVVSSHELLAALVRSSAGDGQRAWVALDLDGTLFDNRPRTLAILRAFALSQRHAHPGLTEAVSRLTVDDLTYSPGQAVAALGPQFVPLADAFVQFWRERFFTNAFQALDHVEHGAAAFSHALVDAGLGVVYLTGRDRPGMAQGVLQSLDSHGFPLLTAHTMVVLKPDWETKDVDFKRGAVRDLVRNGPLVGLVDNEPGIVNMALDAVPGILAVRICRPFAPNPPALDGRARQITSFVL